MLHQIRYNININKSVIQHGSDKHFTDKLKWQARIWSDSCFWGK